MRHLTVGLCKWALQEDTPGDNARELRARPGWSSFPVGWASQNGLYLHCGDSTHVHGRPGPSEGRHPSVGQTWLQTRQVRLKVTLQVLAEVPGPARRTEIDTDHGRVSDGNKLHLALFKEKLYFQ